jgi:hypothetical protein
MNNSRGNNQGVVNIHLPFCFFTNNATKTCGGVEKQLNFLSSVKGRSHFPVAFPRVKEGPVPIGPDAVCTPGIKASNNNKCKI